MASVIPNTFKARILGDAAEISAAIDLEGDTIKGMLLTSTHTADVDADVFIDDVSTNEISATGSYSAGGVTLTTTATTDDIDDEGVFDATDMSVTSATIPDAQWLVIYKDTGTPSTSPIICEIDFGSAQSCSNGTFTVTFAAEGIINIG
jgi:hypothetical protein